MTTKTKTFINAEVASRLPRRKLQIYDTEITGFTIRCRASGHHSYRMTIARGRVVTLGRVGKSEHGGITAADARAAALNLKQGTVLATLSARAADPSLTHAQAKAHATAAVDARRHARAVGTVTLAAYLTDTYGPWVTAHRKTGAETLARLEATFADLLATPLADLSAFAIERWRTARMKADVTAATTNRDLAALRGALSRAVEWQLISAHPMRMVKAAKTDSIGHVRYLSDAEAARLRTALAARDDRRRAERTRANAHRRERGYDLYPEFDADGYTDHVTPIVLLALNTGCRRGEILALTWRDVDLRGAYLTVRAADAKSGRSRVVPLNREAIDVLNAYRPADAKPDAPIFAGANGAPLQEFKTAWGALMLAAKIKHFRFHDCRHDFASKLVQSGVDLFTVSKLLGHADTKMTTRYAHLSAGHMAAAVAKLVSA